PKHDRWCGAVPIPDIPPGVRIFYTFLKSLRPKSANTGHSGFELISR
ncbi:MAG: hypothetical protein ACJA2G_003572, partial [Cognaticolwellia sp.]